MEEYLSRDELITLQQCLFEMLVDFDTLCKNYHLCYSLAYGSALGAYRHEGFIPWDDDLDIMMPREDYERLHNIFNLDGRYVLQDIRTEKGYFHAFSKLRKKNSTYIEKNSEGAYDNNGVFIDIFPLDYIESPALASTRIKCAYIKLLNQSLSFRACSHNIKKEMGAVQYYLKNLCSWMILHGRSNREVIQRMEKVMTSTKEKKYIFIFDNAYGYKKEIMPSSVILQPILHKFCGYYVYVPNQIEEYLTRIYGNSYMDLPPEEKRKSHKPIKLIV